jgi:hypothetical protein
MAKDWHHNEMIKLWKAEGMCIRTRSLVDQGHLVERGGHGNIFRPFVSGPKALYSNIVGA